MKRMTHTLAGALAAVALAVVPVRPAAADELDTMQRFVDLMQGYFAIIEATHAVTSQPEKAAILQMQKLKELMEERGRAADAAGIFRDVLGESRNPAVRSAAYLLLSETLKETGEREEATRVLVEALKESVANAQP